MRRLVRVPLEQLKPVLLELPTPTDPAQAPERIDFGRVFGNERPVELEVGFGKGLFLVTASQQCPEVNFAGIEIERKYVLYTATRLVKRNLSNVRVVHGDARTILRDRIGAGVLQAVHVYFPDPWWKKRHHKRRVFTAEFVAECVRILKVGGKLHVVTDVEEYFQTITELLAAAPGLRELPPPQAKEAEHDLDYLTNFERKFRKQGKPIWRAAHEKSATPS